MSVFSYKDAFVRNKGWVTAHEQEVLRRKRVAIAGLGGVGGAHLLTLARLGIGNFSIADFDKFEIENLGKSLGAFVSTLGTAKIEVMANQAMDVNPEISLKRFPKGIGSSVMDEFLAGADLYVDGLDFFAFSERAAVFSACNVRGIPAITAAPLGMGAALLVFMPGGMTFEEYFGWAGASDYEKALRFAVGLAPAFLHRTYLVDPTAVDLEAGRGPSTGMACQICAGVAAACALKILLGRGKILVAPHGSQFDAYRNRLVKTWRPGGHRNPLQRLAIAMGRRQFKAWAHLDRVNCELPDAGYDAMAPSGDNTQPWRQTSPASAESSLSRGKSRDGTART